VIARSAHLLLRLPRQLVVLLLRGYRAVVSPLYGPTCRFYPSCSEYALIAVDRHGVVRGGGLAAWRLLRCNPWNPGGVDLVPPARGTVPPVEHTDSASVEDSTASGDGHSASAGTTPAPPSLRRVA
jgi:putative membrane protein insertion efficiency factor